MKNCVRVFSDQCAFRPSDFYILLPLVSYQRCLIMVVQFLDDITNICFSGESRCLTSSKVRLALMII